MTNNNLVLTASIASGAAIVGAIGLLALKYPDRAIFDDARKDIPRVKGYPLVGTLFQDIANLQYIYDAELQELESLDTLTMVRSAIGLPVMMTTICPENILHILKTNFSNYVKGDHFRYSMHQLFGDSQFLMDGGRWKHHRKIAGQIFSAAKLQDHFTHIILNEVQVMTTKVLDQHVLEGSIFDFQDLMFRFTMDTFMKIGFGKNMDTLTSSGVHPFAESFDVCQRHCYELLFNPTVPLFDMLDRVLHPQTKTTRQHYDTLNQYAYDMIKERRKDAESGRRYDDLLAYYMSTTDEAGQPFSDRDLRDMLLSIVVAGRDTTACALSWALYCLTQHPRVEATLLAEIERSWPNIEDVSPELQYKAIKGMTYAHAIFFEVLRLYPPAPINSRTALNDDILPDGALVRKGDMVFYNIYAQSRSTKVWGPDCLEFKPERWITEDGRLKHESEGKFPVFHVAPRSCLGRNMAILESVLVIVTLMKKYKFSLVPSQKIEYFTSMTMCIKNGLKINIEKR